MIYYDEQLIAALGVFVCEAGLVPEGERPWRLRWEKIIIARSNDEVCGDHAVGHRPVQPASVGGGDAAAGQAKAAACAACHGAQGKVTVPMYPNLAGQNAVCTCSTRCRRIRKERNGGQAEVMKAYVSGLSDDDIADLAAFTPA